MKKLILTCALLTSASMLSFAQSTQTAPAGAQPNGAHAMPNGQQRPTPEIMAEKKAQMYKQKFNLDDNQYKGVYAAETEYVKQMMAFRAKGQQPAPAEMQEMVATKDAKFKAAMSADQYEKYMASKPQQRMPQAAPNGAAAPAGSK